MKVVRKLKDQVLASTHLDSHGDRIARGDLHRFFEQTDDPSLLYYNHDMSNPPVARLRNKRFVETADGEFALIADIDILDADAYERTGGFSIAFSSRRGETAKHNRSADLTVHVDLRAFDYKDIRPLLQLSCEDLTVATRELKRKAFAEVAILLLVFAGVGVANGFFGEAGADVYRLLKEQLKNVGRSVRSRRNAETSVHVRFPMTFSGREFMVLVEVPVRHLDITDRRELDLVALERHIRKQIGESVINQIALRVIPDPPYFEIKYFIDADGDIVTLN